MKKFLSILLALTLVVGMLTAFTASAAVNTTVFYNAATHEPITSLDGVDSIYATTTFTGRYEDNASVIASHYDADGKLTKVEFINPVESTIGASVTYTTPAISVADTDIIKIFAWTGVENIKPLLKFPGVISKSVDLPTATATELNVADITDVPLTFAMNFKADPVTQAQLLAYGNWYADFVLTVNKDVTYNLNGTKDGYLAGQYDSWSPAWVTVPKMDVTVAAGEPVKIMETAAETYGKAGLKYTYMEVYDRVKDFDCGVFFNEEFLAANPDIYVTLELRIYNPLDESQSYLIGETYTFPKALTTETEQVLTYNNVTAEVPAGVILENGVTELTLTTTALEESASGVEAGANETLSAMDVHVEGVSDENTTPIIITIDEATEPGLNKGNLSLYHVEDGEAVAMEEVESKADLVAHNQFTYDPEDGTVSLALATFSEVAMVVNNDNAWNGNYDYTWYNVSKTEFTIANADQMAGFSAIVGGMNGWVADSFDGKTVKLMADLNFGGVEVAEPNGQIGHVFYPVGYYNSERTYTKTNVAITSGMNPFEGTFDGNGHTIRNIYQSTWIMKGDHDWYTPEEQYYRDGMGIFGKVYGGTIKNLTVDNFQSDGEITTTGVIASYAESWEGRSVVFENIAITNCNPRVYNIGNGGIVGSGGWYSRTDKTIEGKPIVFRNITVDNTNKISALWGSWDVACAGIMGRYYPDSNCGVSFENCHVAAQIDVYNDVCGNYQYYWYRYAGMMIGTVEKSTTDANGYTVPDLTGITATDCTVHFGDWNNYYYCELVDNSLASYTHDHQFSRLTEVDAVDTAKMVVIADGKEIAIPTSGRANYVVVNGNHSTENAKCYHFLNGAVWNHADAGEEVVDGETVLKEDKQHIYLPFNQLFQGDGWGVKNIPVYNGEDYAFEGITILDREVADSVPKFTAAERSCVALEAGKAYQIEKLFEKIEYDEDEGEIDPKVDIQGANVQVTVSPANEESTVSAIYNANAEDWTKGTITFSGEGAATITITDYYFCVPTTIEVNVATFNQYTASYAGVYQVTSDKNVTVKNESGHTVTLVAGETEYFYLIQGNNNLILSDKTATLTFTKLANNGLSAIGEVTMTEEPIVMGDTGDTLAGFTSQTLSPGETMTVSYTPSFGAGIVYPYIASSSGAGNSVRVTTDTGYYADVYLASNYSSSAWADAARQDPEMLYVRDGVQEITIENIGSSNVALYAVKIQTAGCLSEADYWKDQMNMASLKVVLDSSMISYSNAPYAGVYEVKSDKDVTLTNETGHTVSLVAGETRYFYLIQGANNLTMSTNASLTFTALEGNGLDYIGEVSMTEEPITGPEDDHNPTSGAKGITLAAGESRSFTHTPTYGAGIYYPFIAGTQGGTVKVTTDTGYYAEILLKGGNSSAWADAGNKDPEMVYLRDGSQTITLTNTGSSSITINATSFGTTQVLSEADYWKDQMNMASLKVVPYVMDEVEPEATTITYDAPYAGVYQVTSNKPVTLTNETGHTVTLKAGISDYFYFIAGKNTIETTDTSITLTVAELPYNGVAYIGEVEVAEIAYSINDTDIDLGNMTLAAGESVTRTVIVTDEAATGIVYAFLNVRDNYTHTFKITSDTGYYAELLKDYTGWQTTCWTDGTAQQDMEFVFLRKGENTITITNTGSNSATLGYLRLSNTGEDAIKNHAVWGPQVHMNSLKTIDYVSSEPNQPAPPIPTFAPVGNINYTAENAGIYRVTSDKAVTLINETGSTATIVNPGEIAYIYLIKGENKLQTSEPSATLSFSALADNGMSHIGKIETAYTPYGEQHVLVDIHAVSGSSFSYETGTNDNGKYINVGPGGAITYEVTMSADGAGIIYPFIGFGDVYAGTFEVTSDTGFYAEIVKPAASGSYCWTDGSEKKDMEFLYVREGKNLITIKNTGSGVATITAFRVSMTDGEDSIKDNEDWGSQICLASLKVDASGSATVPAPQSPDVYDTDLYKVSEGAAGSNATATTYNGKQAIRVGSETDSATVSTVTYSINAEEATTYNLHMVAAAWKDINFDLYVDGTLVDYCTMHFADDVDGTNWAYLEEQIASIQLTQGTHTLKLDFYTDEAYVNFIALENTESATYHLIHDFKNIATSMEAYELLQEYADAACIDLAADTANHAVASMSFWKMVGKDYASYAQMYADYKECVIDPVVTIKDENGYKVSTLPEGTGYVIVDSANIPASVSMIVQVYHNGELFKQVQLPAPENNISSVKFTDLPAGCTLEIQVSSDEENTNQSGIYRELYVATDGSASAAGTASAPVNTLEAALNIVKGINASMTGDIVVNVAPGTYNLSETLEINSAMSGKNGYQVIIRAEDPDNKPVISGGEDLTGKWTKVEGQSYWVADTNTTDTRTLYVNDYQATLAKSSVQYQGSYIAPTTPLADHHTVDGLAVSLSTYDFPEGLEDADRLSIMYNIGWATQRFPVESVSYDSQYANIYMKFPYFNEFCRVDDNGNTVHTSTVAPTENKDFYLENAMELLDEEGEFYFDAANQKMYYYPYANEDMTTAKTVCGVTDILVNIEGSSKNKVNNLQFEGISFKYGAYNTPTVQGAGFNQADEMRLGSASAAGFGSHLFPAQVQVNYADAVVFTDCEFACLGSNGLAFNEGVSNSAVTGSYFHELSGTGVTIGSFNHGNNMSGAIERSKNISVDNNIFRRCAQEYMGLTAVSLYYASNVNVSHNDIKDLPYTAITIGWGWGYDDPEECGGHTINYNKIENVMQVLSDGSHIYTLGNLRGTQINDNYLIDPGDLKASAIYFDEGTGYTNAYDNVITGATGSNDKWLFARNNVNINNCSVGFNHSDGESPDTFNNLTERYYGFADGVELVNNKNQVTSWSTTANKIMAAAGVEDKARLNEIDTYPSWRTIPRMRAPAGN